MFSYILCIIRPYWHLQFIALMPVFILKYKQMTFLFFLPEFHCSLVEHFIIHVNYVILLKFHQYLTSAQNLDNDFILWIYRQKYHGGIMWWSALNCSGNSMLFSWMVMPAYIPTEDRSVLFLLPFLTIPVSCLANCSNPRRYEVITLSSLDCHFPNWW